MATLQQQIAEKFLAKLTERKDFDAQKVEQLRAMLADDKKPKADELVQVFSSPAGGNLA
jgi:4-hydroxyphenylpyruvate dioxygenase-like putative hemolysin